MANKVLKCRTQRQYLKHPGECPFCKNENIDGDSVEIDGKNACQIVRCLNCDATWQDSYTLSGFEVLAEPGTPE